MERNGLLNRLFDREKNQYDYEDLEGYRLQLRLYLVIHLCLEVLYIWCRCTPMVICNILSIIVYLISKGTHFHLKSAKLLQILKRFIIFAL